MARRYRGVGWIHYDLINEPSYAPPDGVWKNLPIGDANEARAWRAWVEARHGSDPMVLRDLWRDRSDDLLGVPGADEIGYNFLREGGRRPAQGARLLRVHAGRGGGLGGDPARDALGPRAATCS